MCITSGKIKAPTTSHRRHNKVHTVVPSASLESSTEYEDVFTVHSIKSAPMPMTANFIINGIMLNMEIDSGAAYSIIHLNWYDQHKHFLPALTCSDVVLKTYTGEDIKVAGAIQVDVRYREVIRKLQVLIVEQGKNNLCGRDWIQEFKILQFTQVGQVAEPETFSSRDKLDAILKKHRKVFEPGLGCLKNKTIRLKQKPGVQPKFFRTRTVPHAYKQLVSKEIDRLVETGILSPVGTADWAAPIVPVLKKDKKTVRICGDFKLTANTATDTEQFPLPRVDDLHAKLAGGVKFTKLDMSDAYNQIMIDEQTSDLLVINTERGLFKYNRLPFGVSSASAVFQRELENVVGDVPRTSAFQDDLLISGVSDDDHLVNLDMALTRIEEAGLKLRMSKCEFMNESVEYLGHRIDATGVHPTDEKVKAISQAPTPINVDELRAFIGLLTYYAKFIPNMSSLMFPLYKLLRNGQPWMWEAEQSNAFHQAKNVLSSDSLLVHYDPDKELILSCDASPYGIGAVLSHQDGNVEQPIAYASRTLSAAEKNYSQIEREALALVFAVTKFRSYLFGKQFVLITDHKPLTTIFSENKAISQTSSSRMQRWALTLAAYDYRIKFKNGKQNANADALSRLPMPQISEDPSSPEEVVLMLSTLDHNLVTSSSVRLETAQDLVLTKIAKYVRDEWPEENLELTKPYWSRRFEISNTDGILIWHNRAIIPASLRTAVLVELHEGHTGITRMKRLARSTVWWPDIDKDIADTVQDCVACQLHACSPPRNSFPWPCSSGPWSRIHLDFAGPIDGFMLLVVVDPQTNWIEVAPMKQASAGTTADEMRLIVARYGLPDCIVTDNATQFTGAEFQKFVVQNNIKHITTAPYHPNSNGPAERAVRTIKEGLKKVATGEMKARLAKVLFAHRRTASKSTQRSPFQFMMTYKVKSRLDLIVPGMRDKTTTTNHKFNIGDAVWSRDFSSNRKGKWIDGKILRSVGSMMYDVETCMGDQRRHVDQLRNRKASSGQPACEHPWDIVCSDAGQDSCDEGPSCLGTNTRYPSRIRRSPDRLNYRIKGGV